MNVLRTLNIWLLGVPVIEVLIIVRSDGMERCGCMPKLDARHFA